MQCLKFESNQFPVVRKCCYCVPIRRGVIIYGYVNLVVTLLSLPILIFMLVGERTSEQATDSPDRIDPNVHLPLTITLVAVDVILTVILLIGAHKKKKVLLKIYFYASLVYILLTVCIDLVYFDFYNYAENITYVFVVVLNLYLIFLVYNTVYVIEEQAAVQYVTYRDQQLRL